MSAARIAAVDAALVAAVADLLAALDASAYTFTASPTRARAAAQTALAAWHAAHATTPDHPTVVHMRTCFECQALRPCAELARVAAAVHGGAR